MLEYLCCGLMEFSGTLFGNVGLLGMDEGYKGIEKEEVLIDL